ncbi:MAG: ABC transporter permease [Candidatus Omnitrophica bacterium]|nr:ABC transporter permease [Candidatus Omnitrophota bacterium]
MAVDTMVRIFKESVKWRDLIIALALKELKQRYKQRYLRAAWAAVNPLFTMVIFVFIFSRVAGFSSEGVPYPVFNFVALVPWSFFAGCLVLSCNSLISNYNLITRLRFPRITIPISSVMANLLDFAITIFILAVMFAMYHISIGISAIYLIPVFLIQLLFTFGMAFILSISNAYLRDIQSSLTVIIQAWMLISPVAYSLDMIGEKYRFFYLLNPMAGILDSYRKILIHNTAPDFYCISISFFVSLAVFVLGYWFFKKLERDLADII